MVVRRTDNGEPGLTAAAWLEDRTTTTYQPSHLRHAAARRRDVGPAPRVFGPGNLAPAMAGAASGRASLPSANMYAHAQSPRLALHEDNPFARPRSALGVSFWNALAFAGLFASVLIGRVIVQAGQEGAQAAAPRTAAATAAPAQRPTGVPPQHDGAGGVGVNALAPSAQQEPQPAAAPAEEAQPSAARGTEQPAPASNQAQPSAARDGQAQSNATRGTAQLSAARDGQAPLAAARAPLAAARGRHAEGAAHRSRAARAESDWRRELPAPAETPAPAPLPAAKQPADPSAALGTLRINSRPWSQVFIDGRLIGNTPQLGLRLPAGRYTVRLANPELGMTKTIIVNVPAGELVSRVETLAEP